MCENPRRRFYTVQLIQEHEPAEVPQIFFIAPGPWPQRPARVLPERDEDVCDHQLIRLLVEALNRRLDRAGDLDLQTERIVDDLGNQGDVFGLIINEQDPHEAS